MAFTEDDLQQGIDPFLHVDDNWTEHIADNVSALSERWGFVPGVELQAGFVGYLIDCRLNDGRDAVLKLRDPNDNMKAEAQALKNFGGVCVPDVLQVDEDAGAILMSRIHPGKTLLDSLPEVDDDEVIVSLISSFPDVPATGSLRSAENQLNTWAQALDNPPSTEFVDDKIFRVAAKLLRELADTQSREQLTIHGDIHLGNALTSDNGWQSVDPKGFSGTRNFDYGFWLGDPSENSSRSLEQSFRRRMDVVGSVTDMSTDEMVAWALGFRTVIVAARVLSNVHWDLVRSAAWVNAIWETEFVRRQY